MELSEQEKITWEKVLPLLDQISPICAGVNIGIVIQACLCLLASSIAQTDKEEGESLLRHIFKELPKLIEYTKKNMEMEK